MTLKTAIKRKNVSEIRKISKDLPIADIADLLEILSSDEIATYFHLLKSDMKSDIFSHLEHEHQERLIKLFNAQEMREIVGDLYSSDIVDLIEGLPRELVTIIFKFNRPQY